MKDENIIKEAYAYINNDKTVAETAEELGISKRTFQLHIKKLEIISPELHDLVLEKQKSNQNAGRRIGGAKGKRGVSYTEEEAQTIASEIISQHLTYQEAETIHGRPSSTIYDIVHSSYISLEMKDKLDITATENKIGSSIDAQKRRR